MKIWFQNRRYKTKRKQLQQDQHLTVSAGARQVAVRVLIKDDQRLAYADADFLRPLPVAPSIPIPGLGLWPFTFHHHV